MASRVLPIGHFRHAQAGTATWHRAIFLSGLALVGSVGRFVRAFLEVEPIFLKRY